MNNTIADLWYGNLSPADQCGAFDPEINHLVVLMERNRETLCPTLSAAQHAVFEKYADCWEEYHLRLTEQAFCDGFCLAGKLLTEALSSKCYSSKC